MVSMVLNWGLVTYDVRTEGEGVAQKQTIVLIGCVSGTVTRGRGFKKYQIFVDVIREQPPREGRERGE